MKEKKHFRKCPECGNQLGYTTKYARNNAIKLNQLCNSCARLGERHHLWKGYGDKHFCSDCGRELKYASMAGLRRAQKNKSICKSCNAKKRIDKIGTPTNFLNSSRMTGKHHSDKTREKMSEATKKQVITNEHRKNMRLARIKVLNELTGQISPAYNPNAIPILEQKAEEIGITDIQHAENGGEFYIKELGYWVDGYSSEKNIVIEYYEKAHDKKAERDKRRKQEIINHLNCQFIEIRE